MRARNATRGQHLGFSDICKRETSTQACMKTGGKTSSSGLRHMKWVEMGGNPVELQKWFHKYTV